MSDCHPQGMDRGEGVGAAAAATPGAGSSAQPGKEAMTAADYSGETELIEDASEPAAPLPPAAPAAAPAALDPAALLA